MEDNHNMRCGHCGRTWNDEETPTPAARCPYEYDHEYPEPNDDLESAAQLVAEHIDGTIYYRDGNVEEAIIINDDFYMVCVYRDGDEVFTVSFDMEHKEWVTGYDA